MTTRHKRTRLEIAGLEKNGLARLIPGKSVQEVCTPATTSEMPSQKLHWTSKRILAALVFNVIKPHHIALPEMLFGGGRADFVTVSPSGYATEYEIKVTMSDWNADRDKAKWKSHERKFVKRMFYAVPAELADRIPAWVPESTGIIKVWAGVDRDEIDYVRQARDLKAEKLPEGYQRSILRSGYFRYWERLYRDMHKVNCRHPEEFTCPPVPDSLY